MTKEKIAVVGLGYVGLPLAVALAKKFGVLGFDINPDRVKALRAGEDWTNEVSDAELDDSTLVECRLDQDDLHGFTPGAIAPRRVRSA